MLIKTNTPVIIVSGGCHYDGCEKEGKHVTADQKKTGFYCEEHAILVAKENYPEYIVLCPNCGCRFGVN